jgi:hypothetical protein
MDITEAVAGAMVIGTALMAVTVVVDKVRGRRRTRARAARQCARHEPTAQAATVVKLPPGRDLFRRRPPCADFERDGWA